jgi:hypothetical protein
MEINLKVWFKFKSDLQNKIGFIKSYYGEGYYFIEEEESKELFFSIITDIKPF